MADLVMASVNPNGVLSAPSDSITPSTTSSTKRKHDEIEIENHTTWTTTNTTATASANKASEDSQTLIRDLIDVLKLYDTTTPSILNKRLLERAFPNEPQAKRHKVDGKTDLDTILTRQASKSYSTIEEVLQDIDWAVAEIAEKLQLPKAANHSIPPSPSQTETFLKITAFKTRAHELVSREMQGKGSGSTTDSSSSLAKAYDTLRESRHVLTLYGSAGPQSKQLFSSLQQRTKVAGESKDIVQTLRESGLPSGITTTQIVPLQSTGLTDDKKRVATLGELFPAPSTIPQLQPPKPSKTAITRSSVVGWYKPGLADAHSRGASYFKQPISTGQWLDYSTASPSPGSKKKQRDRALSLGAPKAPQLEMDTTESESARMDNSFRSAYSSFAPCKDDAAAIIPGGMLDRIWWQQIGEKSFDRLVRNSTYVEDVVDPVVEDSDTKVVEGDDEEERFRQAVENFTGPVDPNLEMVVKAADEKDVDEVLEDISELLRTLNSHQRNRHLNLNPPGRPSGLLSAPDTTSLGTPSKPSEPEISVYEILKSQLTLMIATLPPYAVAKLDSEQLAELAISTKMEIRLDDHKGVMEEDEASARAKAMAFSAASAARPVQPPQHRSSSAALYGNQYSGSRTATPVQHQYYGPGQTPVRQAPNSMQRPPTTTQVPYTTQRPAANAPYRAGSYGPGSYQTQTPRPQQAYTSQPQYQQSAVPNYNRPVSQSYQAAPQSAPAAASNPRYTGQPYAQQPPAAQNGGDYRYGNGVSAVRQVSPQKPMHSPQPAYNQHAQSRPAYATPTPSIAQDRRPYLQNPLTAQTTNGGPNPTHPTLQHVPQQQLGPTNYSTFMTTEQQSNMVERQKAQLAQQQGLQQMARSAAQAGTIGSPNKSQVNGHAVTAGS